eukprot:gnl/TRDRNA2_/TRDRNA2_174230_c4_seq53.p1 gnl/TRDRNA2_/TRDRNA2_174230_c4~~gnl/TRDRNA2_/TRDRNA2_174230_c4_seq53.p1  ORF type:complete len:462 (-),score=101.04 gnl/TRDRNA2_/TRDRNA2_174230_c4_seq53:107-1492(-)
MVGEIQERDGKLARYLSEFLGTFLLVFTVGCNVLAGDATWAVTSIACVYMVSIYALGDVSGAHFNPAVSLSLGISRKLQFPEMGIYIIIQLVAGLVAALCYSFFFSKVFFLTPGKDYTWLEASIAELIYTAMLCFVVLNVACSKKHAGKNQFYGLAIGFVIVAGGYGAGHISGGCFNPAVAFGIDVSSAHLGFGWALAYTGFEVLGAALAAFLFRVCRPEDFDEAVTEQNINDYKYQLATKLCSEFLGTYFLVLTVGLNVIGGSPAGAYSIAAALMCMIYALGSCSGAHFNPAVTVAIVATMRDIISIQDAVAYIAVQLVGGIAAAFTYVAMENGKSFPLGPGANYGWAAAGVAEVVFTFVLCFVVLSVATTKKALSEFFGFAIGSCVTVGGYAIGAVSGGSLNPAVSVGIATGALKDHASEFWHCAVYTVFELIGAGIAVGIFMVCHEAEYATEPEKESA